MVDLCVKNTPLEYYSDLRLWVKREDLSCPGGPNFSKMRGVEAHIKSRPEKVIGVLDTSHSQGGWAVARACAKLGKLCVVFYPRYKGRDVIPEQQVQASLLGAHLFALPAGRSAVLYHSARKALAESWEDTYMMPNALKLKESVLETRDEFLRMIMPREVDWVLVSASSGTLASGVLLGVHNSGWKGRVVVHLGYSRSARSIFHYMSTMSGLPISLLPVELVDENYSYSDSVRRSLELPFPCNEFYDRKAADWFLRNAGLAGKTLLWNIG